MSAYDDPAESLFEVVVNAEGEYAVWNAGNQLPAGWSKAGHCAARASCLAYIETAWTDMRPVSVRQAQGGSVS